MGRALNIHYTGHINHSQAQCNVSLHVLTTRSLIGTTFRNSLVQTPALESQHATSIGLIQVKSIPTRGYTLDRDPTPQRTHNPTPCPDHPTSHTIQQRLLTMTTWRTQVGIFFGRPQAKAQMTRWTWPTYRGRSPYICTY